ncbi:MAG: energy transducer TonB [Nitrospirae bacterium]|nr:energy transducer TonB [Nitrospirota bacterium]
MSKEYKYNNIDNLWERLPWVTLISLLTCLLLMWGAGFFLKDTIINPISQSVISKPIYAQFIKLQSTDKIPSTIVRKSSKPLPKRISIEKVEQVPIHEAVTHTETTSEQIAPLTSINAHSNDSVVFNNASKNDNVVGNANETTPKSQNEVISSPPTYGAAYLDNPKPVYPAIAKRLKLTGIVMLKVMVSHDGSVIKIEIIESSGHEILDKSAYEAVIKWHFVPARKGNNSVDEWVQVPIAFRLN